MTIADFPSGWTAEGIKQTGLGTTSGSGAGLPGCLDAIKNEENTYQSLTVAFSDLSSDDSYFTESLAASSDSAVASLYSNYENSAKSCPSPSTFTEAGTRVQFKLITVPSVPQPYIAGQITGKTIGADFMIGYKATVLWIMTLTEKTAVNSTFFGQLAVKGIAKMK
jgi:hypothetical protein